MAPGALTAERRALAAALLWLAAGALAGVAPGAEGVAYRIFGMVEGVFALLLVHLLLQRGAWLRPPGWAGWVAIGYGAWATAQLLELLLPPPGVLEWLVVTFLALTAWSTLGGGSRERLVALLASLTLLLAVLNFSVIPALWERAGPGPGEAWGLGDLAEGVRRLVVDYQPAGRGREVAGAVAAALWAAGTRLLWAPGPDPAPVAGHGAQDPPVHQG